MRNKRSARSRDPSPIAQMIFAYISISIKCVDTGRSPQPARKFSVNSRLRKPILAQHIDNDGARQVLYRE